MSATGNRRPFSSHGCGCARTERQAPHRAGPVAAPFGPLRVMIPVVRLWSLHPQYLDAKGLVALWREALLAQAVLSGRTRGYTLHPQLDRFREHDSIDPRSLIASYLREVAGEAARRGYHFDATKIERVHAAGSIPVTRGQLRFEWQHLQAKLLTRDPQRYDNHVRISMPRPHPLFTPQAGPVASWERHVSSKRRSKR